MDHLPEVELQKEIEDLFYDRKITKDEAIQALQALQQKNPDQFDSEILKFIQGMQVDNDGYVGKSKDGLLVGETQEAETDSGQNIVVASTEYDPMLDEDPNEFTNYADFSKYYDKYGPQAKKYRTWLSAVEGNYPIVSGDAIFDQLSTDGIYSGGELPSKKEIMDAIKNDDKEFFIKYNLDRKKLYRVRSW